MRRFVAVGLIWALAFAFVGSSTSRAATIESTWPVGKAPFGLAFDSTTGKIYVANSETALPDSTGRVSVVDPGTGALASLTTTLSANFVLVDASARRLYSSNTTFSASQSSVDAFDLDTGARLSSVSGGGLSLALDSASGRLFAGGTRLAVIDTSTFTVVSTMDPPSLSGAWFGVAVDPARDRLYLTDSDPTTPRLFVFNEHELTPVGQVALSGVARYAMAVDANGNVLVAGSDPSGGSFSASVLEVIDPDSLSIVHTTPLPGLPAGIAFAPARGRVYVSDMNGRRVYGLTDDSYDVAETIERLPFTPGQPLFHIDGRLYLPNVNSGANVESTLTALDLANHAPIFRTVALSPTQPRTNALLSVTADAYDPDISASNTGGTVTLTYEWSRNGTVVAGATGSSFDLSVAGNGDRGDTISVRVTASDGQLSTDASTSVVVSDSPPTAAVGLSNTAPATNSVVSATATGSDADNDPLSYRFVWRVNGVVRQVTPGPAASDSFDLGVMGNGDHGDVVVVELVASDGTLDSPLATANATVVNSAPTVAVSLNTTTPTPKTVLVATVVGQDPDSDGLTYVYMWKLNGVVKRIVTMTATTDRYDISLKGNGKKGDVVTVTVAASDGTLTSPPASLSAKIR
jgi:DNA-binding beta-propeller fold protein YncE